MFKIWLGPISQRKGTVQKNTDFAKECLQETDVRYLHAAAQKVATSSLLRVKHTTSLRRNHEFKRLYNKGKNSATKFVAVYIRRNGSEKNRLGITVSTKLGGAVVRNRIRRRLKEVYRINEHLLCTGYDVVIVARIKSKDALFSELEVSTVELFAKMGLTKNEA